MDTEVDLTTVDRAVLIAIIAELQAVIERLQRRIAELEGQAKSVRKPPAQQQPRKQRRHGFAPPAHDAHPPGGARDGELSRLRRPPVRRLDPAHSGSLELLTNHLPVVPVQVTEHVYIARTCPVCRRRCTPPAVLDGVVLGQQRRGVNLLSLIATLREEGRLPIRSVQWYLDTVHQLRRSVGAIVSAIHRTAQRAQPAVAQVLERIRASPVVHADETGWRQNGNNGYVWTFSTPTERYFLRRGRGKAVVDEALGESFSGVLVSDFYAAYHHYDGPKQRCWAHLLRDIHDLVALYPKDTSLAQWAAAVHQLYVEARSFTHPQARPRRTAQLAWERQLLAICQPFLADPLAVQAKLCRRIERHIKELFVFVAEPDVPSDNNPAERSLRHLVISRKVSGGTRSERGTESKMTLASIFGTWRAQGLNPLAACRQLLTSPQV